VLATAVLWVEEASHPAKVLLMQVSEVLGHLDRRQAFVARQGKYLHEQYGVPGRQAGGSLSDGVSLHVSQYAEKCRNGTSAHGPAAKGLPKFLPAIVVGAQSMRWVPRALLRDALAHKAAPL
jgi:hypothetical protein